MAGRHPHTLVSRARMATGVDMLQAQMHLAITQYPRGKTMPLVRENGHWRKLHDDENALGKTEVTFGLITAHEDQTPDATIRYVSQYIDQVLAHRPEITYAVVAHMPIIGPIVYLCSPNK